MLAAFVLLALLAQDSPAVLQLGTTLEGEIDAGATDIASKAIPELSIRGEAFTFEAPEGLATLELRAVLFDPYLVVQDENGVVLAEDDNTLGAGNARVVVESPPGGRTLKVWACAKTTRTGDYTLRVVAGEAPIPEAEGESPEELAAVAATLFEHYGLGSNDAIYMLQLRGYELQARRRHLEVLRLIEPAVEQLAGKPEYALGRARLQYIVMLSLGGMSRFPEACTVGRECLPVLTAPPETWDQGNMAFTFARWLWFEGQYEEGLEWIERSWEHQQRHMPEGSIEYESARHLRLSYLRVNGHWDEFLATLEGIEPVVVTDGFEHTGETRLNEVLQTTSIVRAGYSNVSRLETLPFRVEQTGVYTIEMGSYLFDSYLVVRDATGAVVAEDDDGRGLNDARIVTELEAGRTYLLEPTSLHRAWGAYTVRVFFGRPEDRTPWERRQEDLAEAERCMQHAESLDGNAAIRAFARARALYGTLGRSGDAVRAAERELEIRRQLDPQAQLPGLFFLAGALRQDGRAAEALPLIEEVRRRQEEQGGPDRVMIEVLDRLASVRWARGEIEESIALRDQIEERLRAAYGGDSEKLLGAERVRARILAAEGRHPEAIEIGRRVVASHVNNPARETSGLAQVTAGARMELGRWQLHVDDLEAALENFEEALRLYTLAYGELCESSADARLEVAWTLAYTGQQARALDEVQRAREVMEAIGSDEMPYGSTMEADIQATCGDFEQAFELACRAVDASTGNLANFLATLPEALRLRRVQQNGWSLGILLGASLRVPGSEAAAYSRVLAHKEVIGRSLIQSRASVRSSLDPRSLELVEELQELQSELSQAFYDDSPGEFVERLRRERVSIEDELALLGSREAELDTVTVEELQAALPEDAVLVDFHVGAQYEPPTSAPGSRVLGWWDRPVVSAWLLKPGETDVTRVELGPARELEGLAQELGGSLLAARGVSLVEDDEQTEADGASRDERLDALRRRLWDPIAPHVGDAPIVFVSATDFLGAVPFDVLQRDDGSYLVEHHAFVLLSDAAQLTSDLRAGASDAGSLLLVGDVDYDAADAPRLVSAPQLETLSSTVSGTLRGRESSSWTRLPFTATEIERLNELFVGHADDGDAELLTGRLATSEALLNSLPKATWVHIATHGFFQSDHGAATWGGRAGVGSGVSGLFPGLLSGLVLAGANRSLQPGGEDGLLTAEELTWLDLSGCRLVTLSACETGLGSARGGEGLVGLRRAFHQAGAHSVVASLWAVEDEATALLMESFYRRLWVDGRSRLEALRAAKLEMLAQNRNLHGDARPWTWGAFVLSGDWQ